MNNVPRATPLVSPTLPRVIPVVYHGSRLRQPLSVPAVGIPLYKMCGRNGVPRYHSADELCESFGLDPATRIVLTGTALDPPLERWWGLETSGRLTVIRALRKCGIALVTTPNFSLIANVPRWSDLHAMKRIAITCHEFISEGVPAALHVNARTGTDFLRWAEYIAPRSELTHIAFEFTTGPRHTERREQHVQWLQELARAVGRPLNLILRGGIELDPELRSSFSTITFFATSAFMKAAHRQRATVENGLLSWIPSPTAPEESLDELLANNIAAETTAMAARIAEVDFTATP